MLEKKERKLRGYGKEIRRIKRGRREKVIK